MPGRPCERCGAFQRLRAHHCTACERCVDTHDHHCLWLGTCIGARNQAMCAPPQGPRATPDNTAGGCISWHLKAFDARKCTSTSVSCSEPALLCKLPTLLDDRYNLRASMIHVLQ